VWNHRLRPVQSALKSRHLAEDAAAPSDERVHYWIKRLVDEADKNRRSAEDMLLIGTEPKLTEADKLWKAATGTGVTTKSYETAVDWVETKVGPALKTRDEAWAKTPYLAQWALARIPYGVPEKTHTLLGKLIKSNHELGKALDEWLKGEEKLEIVEQHKQDVETNLKELTKAYEDECSYLSGDAGDHKETLRRIAAVLTVPPLAAGPWNGTAQRNLLRRKYLDNVTVGDLAAGVVPSEKELQETASLYFNRLAACSEHPALMILRDPALKAGSVNSETEGEGDFKRNGTTASNDPATRLAAQGQQVRELLDEVRKLADHGPGAASTLAETHAHVEAAPEKAVANVRAAFSREDRLVRAAAGLLNRRPWQGRDPVAALRRLDLHHLMLWHGRRTLEDFWGPKPGSNTPFFEIAAGGYLNSAIEVIKADSGPADFEDRLSKLSAAARPFVVMEYSKPTYLDETA